MPDDFDAMWNAAPAKQAGGGAAIASKPDETDFDSMWNSAPQGQAQTPQIDPAGLPNAPPNAPKPPTMAPDALDYGKMTSDIGRGVVAGLAKMDDTVGMFANNRGYVDQFDTSFTGVPVLDKALGLKPIKPGLTDFQAWQAASGEPNYPPLYNGMAALPFALGPGKLTKLGGIAGYGINVLGSNAAAGAVLEAGEQAGEHGNIVDPAKIAEQAALSAVFAIPIHAAGGALFHPLRSLKWIQKMLGFEGKTKPIPEAPYAPPFDPTDPNLFANETEAAHAPAIRNAEHYRDNVDFELPQAVKSAEHHLGNTDYEIDPEKLQGGISQEVEVDPSLFAEETAAAQEAKRKGYRSLGQLRGPQPPRGGAQPPPLEDQHEAHNSTQGGEPADSSNPTTGGADAGNDGAGGNKSGDGGSEGNGGTGQPPDRIPTVREEAVGLREQTGITKVAPDSLEAKALAPMLDKKLEADQAEHNLRETFKEIERLSGAVASTGKHQVLEPEEEEAIRDMARDFAGLKPEELKRNPDRSEISTIRQVDGKSIPLIPYKPKGKNLTTLIGEAKFWKQAQTKAQQAYEELRDGLGLNGVIPPSGSLEAIHKGRRFIVKHSRQPQRTEGLGYVPQGTEQQNAAYKGALGQLREQAMALKQQLNGELEPSMQQLAANLESSGDSTMAAFVKGRKAIEADDRIIEAAARDGVLDEWKGMLKRLMDEDNNQRKLLGGAMILGGQMLGGKNEAQAATPEMKARQQGDMIDVGGALTLAGAAVVLGPKALRTPAGQQVKRLVCMPLVAMEHSSDVLFGGLKYAINQAEKAGIKIPALIDRVTLTSSNRDMIGAADPQLAGELANLLGKWWKAVSGEGIVPDTVEGLQMWTDAPYMSNAEFADMLVNNPLLNPKQKQRLAQLRDVKDKGAKLLKAKIEALEAQKNPANDKLISVLKCESDMNWDRNSTYNQKSRNDIWQYTASAVTNAAQLGNMRLHAYHYLEMLYTVPAKGGGENFATAQTLLAAGDKNAHDFCNALGMRLPIHGNFADTETGLGKVLALAQEKVTKALPIISNLANSPAAKTVSKVFSGQIAEEVKMNTALVAFSEKAAGEMKYSSGKALRGDVTAWLNEEPHKLSSEFTEAKGWEALGRLLSDLDSTVGGTPTGYRLALAVDRATHKYGAVVKNFAPFTRTRIIAGRARGKLWAECHDKIGRGDFKGARDAARAAMVMTGLSCAWLGGAVLDKEIYDHLLETDPPAAKRYHDSMRRFAVLGRVPGAVGGVLQSAGIDNSLGKFDFVAPHTQPSVSWLLHTGQSIAGGVQKSAIALGDTKSTPQKKTTAGVALAAAAGIVGIPSVMSIVQMERLGRRYKQGEEQAGSIQYTYTDSGAFGWKNAIPEGHKFDLLGIKGEHPHYVNSHFEESGSGLESALTHYLMPGESMDSEERTFNDQVEYHSEEIIKDKYPDAYKAMKESYKQMTPVSHVYSKIRSTIQRKGSTAKQWEAQEKQPGHAPTPKERYDNLQERYGNIEKEMDTPINWGGKALKPKEFWATMLQQIQTNPEWAKQLGAMGQRIQ